MIDTRLFSVGKSSRILFVSSANCSESKYIPHKEIIHLIQFFANTLKADQIFHAGWSFFINGKQETSHTILQYIQSVFDHTQIERYIFEIKYESTNEWRYFMICRNGRKYQIRECLAQQIHHSYEANVAIEFIKDLENLKPNTLPPGYSTPCMLLEGAEHNLFNAQNRGSSELLIAPGSIADRFLNALQKIQRGRWGLYLPSHTPYSLGTTNAKRLGWSIWQFYSAIANDKRIEFLITGNNPKHYPSCELINKPLIWRNGKPEEMKAIHKNKMLHMAIGVV
jgi:hypothetical protein